MARLARAARKGDTERGLENVGDFPHCPTIRRGKITEGSSNVWVEGIAAVRMGDKGDCRCAHGGDFMVMEGSSSVFVNGRPMVRVKDLTLCEKCIMMGTVVDGASTVFVGS